MTRQPDDQPRQAEIDEYHGCFALRCHQGELSAELPYARGAPVELFDAQPEPDFLMVHTGGQGGPFSVAMELRGEQPDLGGIWEDVTEFSIRCTGPLVATGLTDPDPEVWLDCEGGQYRLRISARGRAEGRRRDAECDWLDEAVEHYLVQAWPAQPSAPVVVRRTPFS